MFALYLIVIEKKGLDGASEIVFLIPCRHFISYQHSSRGLSELDKPLFLWTYTES